MSQLVGLFPVKPLSRCKPVCYVHHITIFCNITKTPYFADCIYTFYVILGITIVVVSVNTMSHSVFVMEMQELFCEIEN